MDSWHAVEDKVCRCGSAWGLLVDAHPAVFLAWWVVRHSVYGVIVFVLTISNLSAWVYQLLGVFWIMMHSYKAWVYINKKEGIVEDGHIPHKSLETVVATQPRSDLDKAERGGTMDTNTARILGGRNHAV